MMSHFNDVTATALWLAPIPCLSGCAGGSIDSQVNARAVTLAVMWWRSAMVSGEISNFQPKFTETSQENCNTVSFAFTLGCSDALLMAIKWKCLSAGVYLSARVQSVHHCASATRRSVNLIIYISDVSIIGGIVKLQNSGCKNVNSFLAARQQLT